MLTDPADTGRRVLEALAEGRSRAIAQAQARRQALERLVAVHARRDVEAGRPERGRAGRISRALHGLVSVRHVLRLLESDRLSSLSDSVTYNGHDFTDQGPPR